MTDKYITAGYNVGSKIWSLSIVNEDYINTLEKHWNVNIGRDNISLIHYITEVYLLALLIERLSDLIPKEDVIFVVGTCLEGMVTDIKNTDFCNDSDALNKTKRALDNISRQIQSIQQERIREPNKSLADMFASVLVKKIPEIPNEAAVSYVSYKFSLFEEQNFRKYYELI